MARREKIMTRNMEIIILFLETDHHFYVVRTMRLLLKDKMIENDTKRYNTLRQMVPVHKISCLLTNKN